MGKPSPKLPDESSRQYERLLKGQITSAQYVRSLKQEARLRVASRAPALRRTATA